MAIIGSRRDARCASTCHSSGNSSSSSKQEVARTAGGINDRCAKKPFNLVRRFRLDPVEDWVECAVEKGLNEAVWGVVAASSLSLVALGLVTFGKGKAPALLNEHRRELEE